MGCWGITSFQSDAGLDAITFIRELIPEDGRMELGNIIKALRQDEWNAPPDVMDGHSHTSPMALAEIVVKFLDKDISSLDYEDEGASDDKRFSSITSLTASRESIQWLRDYVSDTLKYSRKNEGPRAQQGEKWGGWFEERNWIGWQVHMENLVRRLDMLLEMPGTGIELVPLQEYMPVMQ